MKKIVLILVTLLLTTTIYAQRGFSYKALITDGGSVLQNHNVDIQTTIIKDDGVSIIYQETHMTTTDDNGIIILKIGEGNTVDGVFSTINWAHDYFLKVEIDLGDGNGYHDFGITEFKAVPYAKYAENGNGAKKINDLTDAVYDESSLFIGADAGIADDGENQNVGIGKEALHSNTTGGANVANGYQTLFSNTEGIWNVAIGSNSLYTNTEGNGNVAVGAGSLYSNLDGEANTAIGAGTLYLNTSGEENTGIGWNTLLNNTTGDNNVAVGGEALFENTEGNLNTAIGHFALYSGETGEGNTALGNHAGYSNTGNGNVFIGRMAGYDETGSNKLYIENSDTATPLIGGDFESNEVVINGKLGVGTSFPDEVLHIKGDASETLKVESTVATGFSQLMLKTDVAIQNKLEISKYGGATGGSIDGINLANLSSIRTGMSAGGLLVGVTSENPMYFLTNNTQRMIIEADGDIQVKNKITAPYSGDADMKAYIFGSTSDAVGTISVERSSDGFEITQEDVGEYRVNFTNPTPGHTYNVVANVNTGSSPRIITIVKNSNAFFIHIWNLAGNHVNEKFNFVVFKK
jgi:hypothetical protein